MDLVPLSSVPHGEAPHLSVLACWVLIAQSTAVPSLFGVNTAMEAKHTIPKHQLIQSTESTESTESAVLHLELIEVI